VGLLSRSSRTWVASYSLVVVAELGVAVEGDLGVEGVDLAGRLEDQRVDLDQVGVALGVGGVELEEDVDGALGGAGFSLAPRPRRGPWPR
jgi:hypothetical protein